MTLKSRVDTVTWMSRNTNQFTPSPSRVGAKDRVYTVWHGLCITIIAGCLYLPPTWEHIPNDPPTVLEPNTLEEDFTMVSDFENLVVIAYDTDGDSLFFNWYVPHAVEHEVVTFTAETDLFVSELIIPMDPVLDGATIECRIFDSAMNETDVIWHMEVP